MYDILAIRAGGDPAFSFSLNKETATVYKFITQYAETISKKRYIDRRTPIAGIPEFGGQ